MQQRINTITNFIDNLCSSFSDILYMNRKIVLLNRREIFNMLKSKVKSMFGIIKNLYKTVHRR